jgi:hypothetical protein
MEGIGSNFVQATDLEGVPFVLVGVFVDGERPMCSFAPFYDVSGLWTSWEEVLQLVDGPATLHSRRKYDPHF